MDTSKKCGQFNVMNHWHTLDIANFVKNEAAPALFLRTILIIHIMMKIDTTQRFECKQYKILRVENKVILNICQYRKTYLFGILNTSLF